MATRSTPKFKQMSSEDLRTLYAQRSKPKHAERAKIELLRRGHALTAE
tara:strand:- start:1937 stop:2080 length:144 start_codon:yes stop_codon:yes gene_type:complete